MPQMDFFLSEKERTEIVKFCLENNFKIIPNHNYEGTEYQVAYNMDEYLRYCQKSPLLFLVHDAYSIYPLVLDSFEKNKQKQYFIKQRYGGPSIDFFTPVIGEIKGNLVGPGFIAVYPFYYNNKEKFFPKNTFKEMYKLLTTYIKGITQEVRLAHRIYWIGVDTIKKAKSGELSLVPISNINLIELVK